MQNVLTSFLGDSNAFYIVAPAGQRCYSSFSSAAQSAADEGSRWNAFHFQTNAGLLQGRSIAGFTLANALAPVPEPQSWVMLILGFGFLGAWHAGAATETWLCFAKGWICAKIAGRNRVVTARSTIKTASENTRFQS